jgi:hypothetical protein
MEYHPHVHLLVTAGGITLDGKSWIKPAYERFLVPGRMLSAIFRAKIRSEIEHLTAEVDPTVWDRRWNVHVRKIGRGAHAARYLSRYVYRVALTNDRIERHENGLVTFRYTHARTGEVRRQTLPEETFIGRFLQHVLPRGFGKIRSYGLLSPSRRGDLDHARELLEFHAQAAAIAPSSSTSADTDGDHATSTPVADSARSCRACHKGRLRLVGEIPRSRAPP